MPDHPGTDLLLYLYGELPAEARRQVAAHLEACVECAAELAELAEARAATDALPRADLASARWTAMLDRATARSRPRPLVRRLLAAAALLTLGAAGAGALGLTRGGELSRLRARASESEAAAALSLVRDGSSAERLRGVSFGGQVIALDAGVSAALLRALTRDPSANVRLAVVDALGNAPRRAEVGRAVLAALPAEPLPPVRLAMIDLLARRSEPGSGAGLAELAKSDPDAAVRARAATAAARLEGGPGAR